MKNTECSIIKMHAAAINLKVGVSHGALLRFISLPALRTLEAMFQAKNNVGSTPARTALA